MKKTLTTLFILGLFFVIGCTQAVETTNQTTQTSLASFTIEQVSSHNTKENCWLAIDGRVYDVTDGISKHPGGDAILNGCGKDASQMFSKHSDTAREILKNFYIGELK